LLFSQATAPGPGKCDSKSFMVAVSSNSYRTFPFVMLQDVMAYLVRKDFFHHEVSQST
jgi:hypothetical protein